MEVIMKLEILIKPVTEFGTRQDVAIHSKEPDYNELLNLIDDALKSGFPRIVIYTKTWVQYALQH